MSMVQMMGENSSRSTARERIVNCTHLKLTRLYDELGCNKCSICHKRPSLGWLYRCTQDSDGHLPLSDFFDVEDDKLHNQDAQLYTLSPSVIKAAQQGHYTDDELDTLWKQKLRVRRVIQQIRPATSSTISSISSSQYSLPASITTSTIPSSSSELDPDLEVSQTLEHVLLCRSPLEPIQEVHDDLEKENLVIPVVKACLTSPCNFKVCQTCRPVYRERAWQSIDGIVRSSYGPPPRHELENRRISNLNIVKTLGLSDSYNRITSHDYHLRNNNGGSRADFQKTVQRLLKKRQFVEDAERYTLRHTGAYNNLAAFANTNMSASLASSTFYPGSPLRFRLERADDSSSFSPNRPIYARRGFERLTTIQPPPRLAVSLSGESSSSSALSMEQSHTSSPAILDLRIDVAMADEKQENTALPQKTPTESLKESLKRFGIVSKSQSRFLLD